MNKSEPSELTIALAGATSSGKSTLANLLCGRMLLPINVQESPRVVVSLHHSTDRQCRLIQPNGQTFAHPTDAALRLRLEDAIQTALRSGATVPLRVEAPLGLARRSLLERLGWSGRPSLPPQTALCVRDLPGVLHTGDRDALRMLSEHLGSSLVIAVFNAEELDTAKEEAMLRQVLVQKRAAGRSWREVLFVMNRADVFGRDPHRVHDRDRRLADLQRRCRRLLTEVYPSAQHADITVHPLSSLPALAAELLLRGQLSPEERRYVLEVASRSVGTLLDESEGDRLPRAAKRWWFWHVRRYAKAAQVASGWLAFRAALCLRAREMAVPR